MQVDERTMPELTADLETELKEIARRMRIEVIRMLTPAGSGHPGGSLGMADIFTCLYWGGFVRHDPKNPGWPDRDRVVLSNGHICPILYAVLGEWGYFPKEWFTTLRKVDSHLQGRALSCPPAASATALRAPWAWRWQSGSPAATHTSMP
jgi:transketolase